MSPREIAFGTYTAPHTGAARHITHPDLYDATGTPIPAVPADETGWAVTSIDQDFAKAYRATKTQGKADEKVKMAQSLEWLEHMTDGDVIRFTKIFARRTDGVVDGNAGERIFTAIRVNDAWFVSFEKSARGRMTTTELILWLIMGVPVDSVSYAKTWDTHKVMVAKVIEEDPKDLEMDE